MSVVQVRGGVWQIEPGTLIYRVDLKKGIVKTYAKTSNYAMENPERGWVAVKDVVGAIMFGEWCSLYQNEAIQMGKVLQEARIKELEKELDQLKLLTFS